MAMQVNTPNVSMAIRATFFRIPALCHDWRRPAAARIVRTGRLLLAVGGSLSGLVGCADLGGKLPLPSGIPDQQALKTVAGALGAYNAVIATFGYTTLGRGALVTSLADGGLLSDELTVNSQGGSAPDYLNTGCNGCAPVANYAVDARVLPGDGVSSASYMLLQTVRARATQGIGMLAAYDSTEPALRGHLYALAGYAELLLADLFCSGVPLSTFDYNQDFTYRAGSSTNEVYADAKAQFQRALPLLADSVAWLNLARVGLGRAFLNLGQYDSAATAVAAVPSNYVYQTSVNWYEGGDQSWLTTDVKNYFSSFSGIGATVADREGGMGQPYISSQDPRTAVVQSGVNLFGRPIYFPAKYGNGLGITPVIVASGLEARLIRAEATLHPSGESALTGDPSAMLAILNAIRADSMLPAIDPSTVSTPTAAVDTLFTERAAWLFLDGHRLGDLRRLLRRYFRHVTAVFPTGLYPVPVPNITNYGPDVEFPIPATEGQINPYFTGCLSRGI